MADYFPIDMTVGAKKSGKAKRSRAVKDPNACPIKGMADFEFTGGKFQPGRRIRANCGITGADKANKLAALLNKKGVNARVTSYSDATGHAPFNNSERDYMVVVAARPDGKQVIVNPTNVPFWIKKLVGAKRTTMNRDDFMRRVTKLGTGKAGGKKRTAAGREVGQTDGDEKGWPWGWIFGSLAIGVAGGVALDHYVFKKK